MNHSTQSIYSQKLNFINELTQNMHINMLEEAYWVLFLEFLQLVMIAFVMSHGNWNWDVIAFI